MLSKKLDGPRRSAGRKWCGRRAEHGVSCLGDRGAVIPAARAAAALQGRAAGPGATPVQQIRAAGRGSTCGTSP